MPQAKTEGVLQIGKIRMRFTLIRTCPRAAPSVTACAVPPSSGRKAFVSHSPNLSLPLGEMSRSDREGWLLPYAQSKLVSPFGRDVAQRQRGLAPSLRELDCRLAARLREFCQSGKIRMRFALIRICQLFALSVICFANASSPKGRAEKPVRTFSSSAQSQLVSPFGRDVAQRQRGLEPADMAFPICPDTGFCSPRKTKESTDLYSLLWWEVVDSNHRSR